MTALRPFHAPGVPALASVRLSRWAEAANAPGVGAPAVDTHRLQQWLLREDFPGPIARGFDGQTPLMRAAALGDDVIVAALLACGADAQAIDDDGNTALWFACLAGAPAVVHRLTQAGAGVDHTNHAGLSCLMQAGASGWLEMMELLLALGADDRLCAPDGRCALDMAADRGRALMGLSRALARA